MTKPLKSNIKSLKQDFQKNFKNLKHEIEARVAENGDDQVHNINIKGQTNVLVSKNIGQPGGTAHSSSVQDTQIDQDGSRY